MAWPTVGAAAGAETVAGFLLAGGQSTRMGADKAMLQLGGETLAEAGLRKLRAVSPDVKIAGGAEELARFCQIVPDPEPGMGPLAGIVAALAQSSYAWNVFLPVDVPLVPVAALRELIAEAGGDEVAVLARTGAAGVEQVHPLCAVIARAALPGLRAALEARRLSVLRALASCGQIKYVHFRQEQWFANTNTPEEFARLASVSAAEQG